MSVVSVKKVEEYQADLISSALDAHFDVLGLTQEIKPGTKVVIKPNLLSARKPEAVATTHPDIVLAIVNKLHTLGVDDITVADSPGGPYLSANLSAVYSACGYKKLEGLVNLNYSTEWKEVKSSDGLGVGAFNIIEPICNADYIINVAKLKTHSLTGMSGGIKNLFGCIPGLQKPEMHYRFPDIGSFSSMLLDLAQTVSPGVTFIDAISAMEGEGPNMGTPKQCGYFLASKDVFAQDYIAAQIIGISPEQVEMIRQAEERGLFAREKIEIVGDGICNLEFKLPETNDDNYLSGIPAFMRGPVGVIAKRFLKPVPRVLKKNCVGCGKCAESCPEHIIEVIDRKAHIKNRAKCISCFCCQEMCPAHSITVKRRLKQ